MELPKKKGITNAKPTNRLGEKIRSLRVSQNISLKDLAKKSDLTSSTISQVERGLSNPSIPALRRIAETLGVPVFYFFSEEEVDESIIIVRKDQRKELTHPHSNVSYELLSPNLSMQMEVVMVTLEPGVESSDELFTHKGEEVCVVLKGKLKILLGETSYDLEEGDCIQFKSEIPHRYINDEEDATVRLLAVLAPPSF